MSEAKREKELEENTIKLIKITGGYKVLVEDKGEIVEEDKYRYGDFDGDQVTTKEEAIMEFQSKVNKYSNS